MHMSKWDLIILCFELKWDFVTESMITTNEFGYGTQIYCSKPDLEISFQEDKKDNFERKFRNGKYETDFDDNSNSDSD